MPAVTSLVHEVEREAPERSRVVEEQLAPGPGQALARVERFGLSTNNVTYARLGEALGYWKLFPAAAGWGRVPAWGFATVVEGEEALRGRRIFGLVPLATHFLLEPDRVGGHGFADGSPSRRELNPAYNFYELREGERPGDELDALLRPVFFLSFLLDVRLAEAELWGGGRVLLTSASSKAALGTAFLLRRRGVEVVGITSGSRLGFVAGLGVYDELVGYDELERLPAGPAALVDTAGDPGVRAAIGRQLGPGLRHTVLAGATRSDGDGLATAAPAEGEELIFVPAEIVSRTRDWGREEFGRRYGEASGALLPWAGGWLRIERGDGPEAVSAAFARALAGELAPDQGCSLSMAGAAPGTG